MVKPGHALALLALALALMGCSDGGSGPPRVPAGSGGTGAGDGGTPAPKLVFVSSTEYTPAFDTLGAADAICQKLAGDAGLAGSYRAWLSDASGSPSTRFEHSTGPYELVSGTNVAESWAALTSKPLAVSIDRTELDEAATLSFEVWTGTHPNGTASDQHCEGWTASGKASIGDARELGSGWTELGFSGSCSGFRRLYCFEQ